MSYLVTLLYYNIEKHYENNTILIRELKIL